MRALIYTLTAIWVLGLLFAIGRLWYFQIQMFNNFAPGVNPYKVKGGFFDFKTLQSHRSESPTTDAALLLEGRRVGLGLANSNRHRCITCVLICRIG